MSDQYLSQTQLKEIVNVTDFENLKVISRDSYSDTEICKTIKKRKAMSPLLYCAIQTAVVGYGNKTYGEFQLDGEKVDVKNLYKEFGVKDELQQSAKLELGDLTPRRIQRFFRVQIQSFLEQNTDVSPYLWKKYSTHEEKFRTITFPGAESLVESKEEALYLLQTYVELDMRLGTNIQERVKRVLFARKLIMISDL
jgi:hypothetical protein